MKTFMIMFVWLILCVLIADGAFMLIGMSDTLMNILGFIILAILFITTIHYLPKFVKKNEKDN